MPIYEYFCPTCGYTLEKSFPIKERDSKVSCEQCGVDMKRVCGNRGGFRLGQDGSISWSDGGYSSTYGDMMNHKAGRKVY